jgi:hypothetical protein
MPRLPLLVGIAITSFVCVFAHATDSYRLSLQVERDGSVISKTTADVDAGATSDLRTGGDERADDKSNEAGNSEGSNRLLTRVEPGENDDIVVHLQYFEKRQSKWQLLGEPTIVVERNDQATVEFLAGDEEISTPYRITVVADETARLDSTAFPLRTGMSQR